MEDKITVEKLITLLLDKDGKPISLNEMPVYKPEDILKKMRSVKPKVYNVLQVDLTTARTGIDSEDFQIAGDFLAVQGMTGTASIIFNELAYDQITLAAELTIHIPFYRFFLINTAQAGLTVTLIVGRESLFNLRW